MNIRDLGEILPDMSDEEYLELKASILECGLLHPIILYRKAILDGRKRYLACRAVGVEPRFEWYKGKNPVGLFLALNLHRRHLSKSERSGVEAEIAQLRRKPKADPAILVKKAEDAAGMQTVWVKLRPQRETRCVQAQARKPSSNKVIQCKTAAPGFKASGKNRILGAKKEMGNHPGII